MTIIDRSALLPYNAEQVFELVSDIESYPRFMDGCVGAEVIRRGDDFLEARLDLAKGGINQSFSTRNTMVAPSKITLELIDGPFNRFVGRWEFLPLADAGCKASLNLEFEMNSTLLGAAAASLFDRATNSLVDAVARRARQLYG